MCACACAQVASLFREQCPEGFEFLSRTPVLFHHTGPDAIMSKHRTVRTRARNRAPNTIVMDWVCVCVRARHFVRFCDTA